MEATSETANGIEVLDVTAALDAGSWTKVDLLKIDIEGGEAEVFKSSELTDAWLPRVKAMAIEIHDEFECRETIMKQLKKHDFQVVDSAEGLTIAIKADQG